MAVKKIQWDKNYFNREYSWLLFNDRVLNLAADKSLPLLERARFNAIFSTNLDEFFMVRVASIIRRMELADRRLDISGFTPEEQLLFVIDKVKNQLKKQEKIFHSDILEAFAGKNIFFDKIADLTKEQQQFVFNYFQERIFPVTLPMACDLGHPFPMLLSDQLYLAVYSRMERDGKRLFSIIPIPHKVLPRIIRLPSAKDERHFIMLEDAVRAYLEQFYIGNEVLENTLFRVTRDAEFSLEDMDAEDLRQKVASQLKERKKGPAVRLEVEKSAPNSVLKRLVSELEIDKNLVFKLKVPLDFSYLLSLYEELDNPELKYTPFRGKTPAWTEKSIFTSISKKDRYLHHPYHLFNPVVKLVEEAAVDPKVLAVKLVLYRVSANSPIVKALKKAAENGKQVSVLLELYARFDEENNLINAKILEEAGCHVIYGVVGFKTHAKALLIIRREAGGIRRFVHLATGNYNDRTARVYSDFGLFTVREDIAEDVSHLFNVITGYSRPVRWRRLGVAPINLREKILELIENEIAKSRKEMPGHIFAKMNSLLDKEIIDALYRASRSHVKIDLVVRGICALKPGVKGLSENIFVRSIVGRFLEHARIFRFNNNNSPLYFISSADWMPRNLNKRIEALVPVDDDEIKSYLDRIISFNLADNVNSWVLLPDGRYKRVKMKSGEEKIDIFENFMR